MASNRPRVRPEASLDTPPLHSHAESRTLRFGPLACADTPMGGWAPEPQPTGEQPLCEQIGSPTPAWYPPIVQDAGSVSGPPARAPRADSDKGVSNGRLIARKQGSVPATRASANETSDSIVPNV